DARYRGAPHRLVACLTRASSQCVPNKDTFHTCRRLELAKAVSDRQSTVRKCCGGAVPEPGDAVSVRASQRAEGGSHQGSGLPGGPQEWLRGPVEDEQGRAG